MRLLLQFLRWQLSVLLSPSPLLDIGHSISLKSRRHFWMGSFRKKSIRNLLQASCDLIMCVLSNEPCMDSNKPLMLGLIGLAPISSALVFLRVLMTWLSSLAIRNLDVFSCYFISMIWLSLAMMLLVFYTWSVFFISSQTISSRSFLGIEVAYSPKGYLLSQTKDCNDVLRWAGLTDRKHVFTPIDHNHNLRTTDGDLLSDPTRYRDKFLHQILKTFLNSHSNRRAALDRVYNLAK